MLENYDQLLQQEVDNHPEIDNYDVLYGRLLALIPPENRDYEIMTMIQFLAITNTW